jgi:1-acyl-sn-glycerol-3-phosphate acyltransferase
VVLTAALPPRFGFVIKREMSSVPLAGLLLTRIGSHFVSRDNPAPARDALRLMRSAARRVPSPFSPRAPSAPEPGLLRHTGAFAAADRAGMPVVPLVIRGTAIVCRRRPSWRRRIECRCSNRCARRHCRVLPDGAGALRDAARAAILAALNAGSRAAAQRG